MVSCVRRCPLQRPHRRVGVRARRPATRPPTSSGSGRRGVDTPSTSSVADASPPAVTRCCAPAARRPTAPLAFPNTKEPPHAPPLPAPPPGGTGPRVRRRARTVGVLPARGRGHPGLRRCRRVGRRDPGRRAAPRLLPEHHPRPRADRGGQRLLPAGAGLDEAHHPDLQRGPRRGLRAAGQLPGRRLHRLRPGDQRVREEQRRGRPAGRGLHLGRRAARRLPRHHLARAAQGQDRRDAAGGEHAGHRASRSGSRRTTSRTAPARTP